MLWLFFPVRWRGGLKAGKGSQWSVPAPSGVLYKYWEMPTVVIGSASKSDSARPCRNPGNVAVLLQLSGNGGRRDSGASITGTHG